MQGDLVGISSWAQERGKQKNHEKSAHFIDAKDLQFACADHIYLTWVESAVFAGGASLGVGSANTLARGGFPEKSILFIAHQKEIIRNRGASTGAHTARKIPISRNSLYLLPFGCDELWNRKEW